MTSTLNQRSQSTCFSGTVGYYTHSSQACGCPMNFSVFVPPQAIHGPVPVVYYLSGLTCTEENFTVKAGAQRYAAEHGLMLVAPDTSPRGPEVPDDSDSWDFGSGAGFYVNATEAPWNSHYQMYSYIVDELPGVVAQHFAVDTTRQGIFGHSMGGHGALVCGLRNPDKFKSISAFAPISAPAQCPWGKKAFSGYLGSNPDTWAQYDASQIVLKASLSKRPILIDQGADDTFLAQGQLLPELFQQACQQAGQPLTLRYQAGYDHSYFFIASFMADHIQHHASLLKA